MLGWSSDRLGRESGAGRASVARFEAGGSDAVTYETVSRLREALERGDEVGRVRFIMSGPFKGGVTFQPSPVRDESLSNPNIPGRNG